MMNTSQSNNDQQLIDIIADNAITISVVPGSIRASDNSIDDPVLIDGFPKDESANTRRWQFSIIRGGGLSADLATEFITKCRKREYIVSPNSGYFDENSIYFYFSLKLTFNLAPQSFSGSSNIYVTQANGTDAIHQWYPWSFGGDDIITVFDSSVPIVNSATLNIKNNIPCANDITAQFDVPIDHGDRYLFQFINGSYVNS